MAPSLEQKISAFYDRSSGLWEQIWGEHMHHGYYGPTGETPKSRLQAQIDLIEELLHWGAVERGADILDVGCGIGGSSIYLAGKFGANVTGITLSSVQAGRGQSRAQRLGLADRVSFQVANALEMPFADQSFDLVWTLESGEHMADKAQFLQECCRVLQPGGKLLMATWCHRPTLPDYPPLTEKESEHLRRIYQVYCLPYVISLPDYQAIATTLPLTEVKTADWSSAVAPFWQDVIASTTSPQALWGLLTAGWSTVEAALSLGLMSQGFRSGLIRYGLLQGVKVADEVGNF
ncbi:methyltransferase domain-containing protein [Thermosynechococcaceae cyanobacterium BACA0444]|uniref:Methyltransferase domain-containing protein n=1 Tax=Pseudocalidococcus azoricus BACA0444 TaxID=2918990 RepID=A0AAE4JWW3_9CYAN|nr:methyltransferase domain-containing protein [Pseudocalidococcus azoricus]MDS3861476.1 methyltransferase domain-containing protein [Pseudocalidococcus azoricus BACA0444]